MIAMQYSFTLPADYDMTIIDRRIRDKGPLLDGFPRLRFKAWLSARQQSADFASSENLYAPFYLWDDAEGIDSFLSSPGFATLARDFGRPSVKVWQVWHHGVTTDIGKPKYATRIIGGIAPYRDLASHRDAAIDHAKAAMKAGALAVVSAFDPGTWQQVQVCLWRRAADVPVIAETGQVYDVGHVSLPASA